MAYAIVSKENGNLYFCGFENGEAVFADLTKATLWENNDHAVAQACLLRNHSVQKKPVKVTLADILGAFISRHKDAGEWRKYFS